MIAGSFKNRVIATGVYENYSAVDILLLKKKYPADNLSKDLIKSGYSLESIPSLQTCKEKNILVHSKATQTLYFAVDIVGKFVSDFQNNRQTESETPDIVNIDEMAARKKEEESTNRLWMLQREEMYKREAYRFCADCQGLFIFTSSGMKMGCGHYLCDSCICRNRGNEDVCGGHYDFPCPR